MSCAYTYAITTPMKCAFGIAMQIEHHTANGKDRWAVPYDPLVLKVATNGTEGQAVVILARVLLKDSRALCLGSID